MHHHARLALALSFLAFAALAAAPALALDGSAVVTGVGAVSFVGAAETNWVRNADTGAHDLLLKFTGEGSFTLPGPTQARVLAVGGGGGGGGVCSASSAMVSPYGGGGGGAGGVVEVTEVLSAATYAVEVGAGGAGGASASAHSAGPYSGASGGDTTLSTNGVAVVTAKGGGGGGGEAVGGDGGSGGGGSQYRADSSSGLTRVGGSGIDGQGHAGGTGDADLYGGGGGGAGSAGAPASTRNPVGGDGRPSDITGETVYYGGGGGGGFSDKSFTGSHAPVSGGRGGGGNGGYGLNVERTDATFYGGGGGGCGAVQSRATTPGGSGYAGVVYVRIAEQTNTTPPVHPFVVRKLYDGEHSVPTDLSTVELAIYSEAAASSDAHGSCLTYVIEGDGIDCTDNTDDEGERFKLNGIYDIEQANHYMATFGDTGWTRITAKLKEGGAIRVTGVFGPYNPEYAAEAPNGMDRRRTLSTAGLLQGQTFYVIERSTPFGNGYEPTGYVYEGDDDAADPRVDATGMTATQKLSQDIADETDPIPDDQPSYTPATVPAGALFLKGEATGSATTVFVVNSIDENKVGFIDVDVTDWDAPYDGRSHGAAVTVLSTFYDDDGEPLDNWWRARYALGDAAGPTNDWSTEMPVFTTVCDQTVWMEFDADHWRLTTTSAVVRIRPAPLAITARDQDCEHDGLPHGEARATYTDPADIAEKVEVSGLAPGDVLASVTLDGARTDPGTCPIVPSGAVVTNATGIVTTDYAIDYTNGTLTVGAPPPPVVSNVVARQRWPWNGLVDVDYEISGYTAGLKAEIVFEEQGGTNRWTATKFFADVEPTLNPGLNRATWDSKAEGATDLVATVVATMRLVREE